MSGRNLALFDFDGTITNCDTLWDFHKFAFGNFKVLLSIVRNFHFLSGHLLGLVSAQTAKESVLSFFWKGKPLAVMQKFAEAYKSHVAKKVRKEAIETIEYHKNCGNVLIIVSASVADWIEPWARNVGFHEVIASQMQISDGVFTGKLDGKNCNSAEKVRRVREKFNLGEFDSVYAYGDSAGDKEMLALGRSV